MRWTEESEEHIARHSVIPDEVEDVLFGQPRFVGPAKEAGPPSTAGRAAAAICSWSLRTRVRARCTSSP